MKVRLLYGEPVVLKLGHRLTAEVVAVDQKEDSLGPSELRKAVAEGTGSEGLARSGGHLDEGAWATLGKRALQVLDGLDLRAPQPVGDERWHLTQALAKLGVQPY